MKAAINGVLNFSVLDGWWLEGYNGKNGWVYGSEQRRTTIGKPPIITMPTTSTARSPTRSLRCTTTSQRRRDPRRGWNG
jgi:hypothetical protein